jgi:hypothetical protein
LAIVLLFKAHYNFEKDEVAHFGKCFQPFTFPNKRGVSKHGLLQVFIFKNDVFSIQI